MTETAVQELKVQPEIENYDQAQLMAQTVVELYQAIGAQNYLEVIIQDTRPGGKKYAITIQQVEGETAGQRVKALQEVIQKLGNLLEGLKWNLDDWEQYKRDWYADEIERGEMVLDSVKTVEATLAKLKEAGLWGTD